MSGKFKKKSQGTAVEEWDINNDISGQKPDFYHATAFSSEESRNRFWGCVGDTVLSGYGSQDNISMIEPFVKKEEPVLRFLNKEQEGYSLTFQKWKGVVKEILNDTFVANLTDIINKAPEEQAELYCSDISNDDKDLLCVGAVFYWCIGYVISASGQQMRTSFLRFQRLPIYTKESLEKTSLKANNLHKRLQ